MSIAVMNWVWASSPTSGNERLALLALADACSRDDGTGCWPSAATIARKANISDRTIRRVIARLEADGQVVVHRGGGRAGSTNSYTVVTGDRVIHNPGQNVTPDKLSGADTSDRPPGHNHPDRGTARFLSELAVPERPPLAAIISRGRVHQRRRLAGFAGLGVTGAAAAIALTLGLTGVFGAAPARGTGTIQTGAFSLTSYANGTVSLTMGQMFDPAALQRALAQHGIPALVKTGTYCSSHPAAPGLFRLGVLPVGRPAGTRHPATPAPGGQYVMESVTLPVKPSQLALWLTP